MSVLICDAVPKSADGRAAGDECAGRVGRAGPGLQRLAPYTSQGRTEGDLRYLSGDCVHGPAPQCRDK
jgi:hypothetical protein